MAVPPNDDVDAGLLAHGTSWVGGRHITYKGHAARTLATSSQILRRLGVPERFWFGMRRSFIEAALLGKLCFGDPNGMAVTSVKSGSKSLRPARSRTNG